MKLPSLIATALENIYISPLELCNLNCKNCYTNKTKGILSNQQILDFVSTYSSYISHTYSLSLKSIIFCGGEIFSLKDFPTLVNQLQDKGIFISLITNGTINRLSEIKDPQNCQILVSLDGPENIHDANRGKGNFQKSLSFTKDALEKGFPTEIMFLVSKDSYPFIDSLPKDLEKLLGQSINLNYITYKGRPYTLKHPLSIDTPPEPSLTRDQIIHIKRNYPSLPKKDFACYQVSLQSNGLVYGCCESPHPLGRINDSPSLYLKKFLSSLTTCQNCALSSLNPKNKKGCGGCTSPDFLCGYKKELALLSCQEVYNTFND